MVFTFNNVTCCCCNVTCRYPTDLEDVSKYAQLFDRLHNNGEKSWSISDLEKIASRNFRRVMRAVEEVSILVTTRTFILHIHRHISTNIYDTIL